MGGWVIEQKCWLVGWLLSRWVGGWVGGMPSRWAGGYVACPVGGWGVGG